LLALDLLDPIQNRKKRFNFILNFGQSKLHFFNIFERF